MTKSAIHTKVVMFDEAAAMSEQFTAMTCAGNIKVFGRNIFPGCDQRIGGMMVKTKTERLRQSGLEGRQYIDVSFRYVHGNEEQSDGGNDRSS